MAVRIGINGFGRIGRYLTRILAGNKDFELVAVNARADSVELARLLKYDSVHRIMQADVKGVEGGIEIGGKLVKVTHDKPGEWSWGKLGCDMVIETTGKFTDRESCEKHLACGAKKVIVSAPAKNPDVTVVMGVNEADLKSEHKIISNASCTTNCLAPVAKVLDEKFGIKHGLMTTIHSYTMSQRILDGSHKDPRRARAACVSLIPTTTGAARAVTMVLPNLKGKLDGMSIRVPTPDGSIVDLTCEVAKSTTKEEVNAALAAAASEHLGYTEEPLVSVDYLGDTHGGVVDGPLTSVIGGTMVKVIVWYDNEAGFTHQLLRLMTLAGKSM